MQLPEREAKEQDITVQAVKAWLQTHHSWLLILDNADELMLLPNFLPSALEGHLLLTTRAAATGRLAHRLEIGILEPEQGAWFLLRRAALLEPFETLQQASQKERELALKISQELGGLPLALDQAGAYLEESGIDLDSYWQIYQQHRADLLAKRGGLVIDHPAPVATTWSLSFGQIKEKNPAAADLLRLCTYCSPDAIPEEILTADASALGPALALVAADIFLLNKAIEALRTYSLVRRDPKEKSLSIHRLVQAVLLDQLSEEERCIWAERAMCAVNAAFPKVEHDTWPQCERLLSQALAAAQLIKQYQIVNKEAGRLLYETATYLRQRVRYQEAEPLHQRALRIQEQQSGPEHPDVATSLNGLAELYRKQSKYVEAGPLYQRALTIREKRLGTEHPLVAEPLNGLGTTYLEQGRYAEAEPLYQRALHIYEQQVGTDHPRVAGVLSGLANLYRTQGQYGQAEPLFQRTLRIQEQQLGLEHLHTAETMCDFAQYWEERGHSKEACTLYTRALTIFEQALGTHHPQTTETRSWLIALLHALGQHEEAARLERDQAV